MRIGSTFHILKSTVTLALTLIVSITSSGYCQDEQETEKTVPVFEDGQAQIVRGFRSKKDWINHDLWVETQFDSDGDGVMDRMHVSVTRPKQTDTEGLKLPVVYVTSPYFAGIGSTSDDVMWNPRHELGEVPPERGTPTGIKQQSLRPVISQSHLRDWVPRGYAVVHSCSPGTGLSDGCPTVGGENESLAPKAVIDWLCGRAKGFTSRDGDETVEASWCTGKVGMTGTSYNGTLPLAAATTGVEGLEAIIPIAPNTSYYHYYRSNGLVRHPGGYMGEDIDVLYDFIHSGDQDDREYCDSNIRNGLFAEKMDRVTGDYNDFWADRDYLNKMENMKAALLMSHGFNDWNVMPEHSNRIYQAAKKKGLPCQVYYHQGGHGGPPPMEMMNKWFTRYLHGVENGVEDDPRAFIVRENDSNQEPTAYGDYPNPEAEDVTFFFGAGGQSHGQLSMEKAEEQGTEKVVDDVQFSPGKLAAMAESENRLLYVSPILKEDLHLSGLTRIKLKLACDKPACNLSVWIVSLPWTEGSSVNSNIITRGWADPQNRDSLTESKPLVAGEFVEVSFDLQPDDQVIPAGQQIGVMVFSSDRDFTLWPDAGTELTVDLDGSSITMPVVGGAEAFIAATQ